MALLLALALSAAGFVPALAEEDPVVVEQEALEPIDTGALPGDEGPSEALEALEELPEASPNGQEAGEGICDNAPSPDAAIVDDPNDGATARQLKLGASKITLGVGERFEIHATLLDGDGQSVEGPLKYASAKARYASVDDAGVVTGRKKGSTGITVTGPNGLKVVCKVTVRKAPRSIKVSARKPKLAYAPEAAEGDSTTLKVTLSSGSASSIAYSGYDPAVVQVSADGKVTAVGYGATFITATTFNGKKARCSVRVVPPENIRIGNIAHRGGAGYWPENTLKAFQNAASTGASAVELDVHSTKDGVQVVHHDSYFTSKRKKVYIRRTDYETLKRLKPSLCTLDEALEVLSGTGMGLYLELKNTANAAACVDAVERWGMRDRTMYISFNASQLRGVRTADSEARLGYIFGKKPSNLNAVISGLGLCAIGQSKKYLRQADVVQWQSRGLMVNVWTVNKKQDINKYIKWGVDSITGDYPRRVTSALK